MSVETWQRQVTPFYGWRLLLALAVLDFINLGFPVTGGAVINTYMLRGIPMSRAIYGLGFTLLNLFVALTLPSVAAFIVKRGVRATLVVGSGAIAAGALSLAFLVSKPWQYLVSFGVVAATGVSFGSIVPITTAVTRWFNRYRGRAMAIALSSSVFGGLFVAPAMNKILVVNHGQWRQAWELIAAVAIVSMIVAAAFVKDDPEDVGQVADGLLEHSEARGQSISCALPNDRLWNSSEAYATAAYWMIVVGGIASYFPFFLLMAHWILQMRLSRFSAAEAAWALAFFSAAGIAGRLIGGWLIDKIASRYASPWGFPFTSPVPYWRFAWNKVNC